MKIRTSFVSNSSSSSFIIGLFDPPKNIKDIHWRDLAELLFGRQYPAMFYSIWDDEDQILTKDLVQHIQRELELLTPEELENRLTSCGYIYGDDFGSWEYNPNQTIEEREKLFEQIRNARISFRQNYFKELLQDKDVYSWFAIEFGDNGYPNLESCMKQAMGYINHPKAKLNNH